MLHAAIEPHPVVTEITQAEVWRWWTVNIYDSLARPCVPLFVMASGFLLLSPEKTDEPLSLFFKKRLSRIALPFIFWGITYFAWRFLVNDEAFAYGSIIQGFNTGPYYHFWFLYMLLGLYMITPIFRVLVAHSQRKILKYFLAIWFLGTAVIPLLNLQTSFSLDSNLFVFVGWIGYFLLGAFLKSVKIKTLFFCTLLSVGWILTMIATYFITASVGGLSSYFFYDYLSANVIMASVGLFMLLYRIPRRQLENISSRLKWLIHKIGQNTLSIFMLHVIILESFQKGFFGFKISVTTINPAIEIPLITGVTLFVCLGIIWSAKKIPFVEKIIG
jgi:surface polysaccharide O-acyltransferase-like enzyme